MTTHSLFIALALCLLPLPAVAEPSQKPLDLLPLSGWKEIGEWAHASAIEGSSTEKKWKSVTEGDAILYNGDPGKTTNIVSNALHGDVELVAEFMIPKSSNSGIYFMNRYELQILDSFGKSDEEPKHGDCAGIYQRWDDTKEKKEDKGFEGTPPSTNASTAPGTWQTYKIIFRAPRFDGDGNKTENARFVSVEHNGTLVHEDAEVTGPTRGGIGGKEVSSAPLKIQGDHGPIAFRKLTVTPLKLD
ncbi:MAG: DUF1080 domain-containing protein [Verrucomicrobiales bacterium]|nr:DUF1080 domain-containing protein [Verrucomicrobiales bacterium]